ncbi:hypothetical protein [Arthrobacter bambusae]|uniref:hypothetical protein n=1 Tax=Arthrobacter bambusae TaxID=1338426 RepID=UPI002783226F|nr:hypothetical protein [Arthrobacter bambusae]MDQ0241215.1 hypothetical protein [Arthrobacter bambusae]
MLSFTEDQANSISYTIRTLRPGWHHKALMNVLGGLAAQGKPVEDVVLASFRAAQDSNAQAPTAITWDQYWTKSGSGKSDNGLRMCGECLQRKPLGHMTSNRPPFICQRCSEA